MVGYGASCCARSQGGPYGEPWGGQAGGSRNAGGWGSEATGAGCCCTTGGCWGGCCTFTFFLGGWPDSGGKVKRVPSVWWERSVTDSDPAAVITGISARVWSPVNECHTASKQAIVVTPLEDVQREVLVDP